MKQISLGCIIILIVSILVITAIKYFSNEETYEQALLKCARLKVLSNRNICRTSVTKKYREIPLIEFTMKSHLQYRDVTLQDFIRESKNER